MSKDNKIQGVPHVTLDSTDRGKSLVFSGDWRTLTIEPMSDRLAEIKLSKSEISDLKLQFDDTFSYDMAGAWLIAKFLETLKLSEKQQKKLPELIGKLIEKSFDFPEEEEALSASTFLKETGRFSVDLAQNTKNIAGFLGQTLVNIYTILTSRKGLRWPGIAYFIDVVGFKAIPIISLISLLIGAVLAYQGVTQLEKFGASSYAVDFLAVSLLREIAVLLTSIVVAGRSGSSFTAQIGTMSLNQEIDAIRMMGLNPFHVLVIPRVFALIISLPLLVLLSIVMGGIGGMIVIRSTIGLPYGEFWSLFQGAVHKTTFWTGMSKAPLFALIIGVIGCYRGMQVKGSAESVGLMTTRSVVESIFMVIICDAIMSIFFTSMDW
ncbi:MlaE family ABC transporter permease [Candidatus Odyssella acanthamoebae]|uniref:MlaE family ABC transporter permease n=1 Tax=Candidatus Odyssella acanthamoebae TaxID=91604 RepID=UPI0006908014|nr:ABC transporter permease [Candidatus Paracaedibacter acanthamoebae]